MGRRRDAQTPQLPWQPHTSRKQVTSPTLIPGAAMFLPIKGGMLTPRTRSQENPQSPRQLPQSWQCPQSPLPFPFFF